jgi:hypothetical protein
MSIGWILEYNYIETWARNGTRDGGMRNVITDPKEAVCENRNWIKMVQNQVRGERLCFWFTLEQRRRKIKLYFN